MAYKYKLEEKLQSLPLNEYRAFMKYAHEALGISPSTLANWRKLKLTDKSDIPTASLLKIAKLFNCSMEDMLNYEVEAKPIIQYSDDKDELIQKFNLKKS